MDSIEGLDAILEIHGLLLVDLDGEEFSGVLVLLNGASGGDGSKSSELVNLKKYFLINNICI